MKTAVTRHDLNNNTQQTMTNINTATVQVVK